MGIAGAIVGIIGNLAVASYKMTVGRRINSATLVADARHSRLDALSSAGALAGLIAVACGQSWGDPVAGLAVTLFICHVGYEVTADVMHRLADGIDPGVEGWIDPDTTARAADDLGRLVADEISRQLPEAGAFTWTTRAAPV